MQYKGCAANRYLMNVTGINISKWEKVAGLPINKKKLLI